MQNYFMHLSKVNERNSLLASFILIDNAQDYINEDNKLLH